MCTISSRSITRFASLSIDHTCHLFGAFNIFILDLFSVAKAAESERVAALEGQAARDAAKIAELEQYRAQALSLTEMKQAWHAQEQALLQQLAAAQHATLAEKDVLEARLLALEETVELATMDKDIAEEKCRGLEQEIIDLKAALDG